MGLFWYSLGFLTPFVINQLIDSISGPDWKMQRIAYLEKKLVDVMAENIALKLKIQLSLESKQE